MMLLSQLKRYFWSLFGVLGIVTFWAGAWDGLGSLFYMKNPLVSLLIGLALLSVSGLIFKEFNPLKGAEKGAEAVLHKIKNHPRKHEFHIKYYDKFRRGHILLEGEKLLKIEKSFMVLKSPNKEVFVPLHRVREVLHKGKTHWKA